MIQHWLNLGKLLGCQITPVSSGRSLYGLIRQWKSLPNWRMRWCTRLLKIAPFEDYILKHLPCTVYIGIRADEVNREGVAYEVSDGVTRRHPLIEWGWGLRDVQGYLKKRGVEIPRRTDCAACFFQTLGEWYILWRDHREDYLEAELLEELTGHTFRSKQRDTWPAGLKYLRGLFERGVIPKQKDPSMGQRRIMCSVCAR